MKKKRIPIKYELLIVLSGPELKEPYWKSV
jgi:hypothetical protein